MTSSTAGGHGKEDPFFFKCNFGLVGFRGRDIARVGPHGLGFRVV